ncbi:response regulator [Oceanobacillus saliphilus]|uniref:response regulator n=1 Tax=Oceanobacillus saliphilus TaxID=2925834 RepID=UPI00201D77A1|nr:response regulator [Oceanobacillus saliphilus]
MGDIHVVIVEDDYRIGNIHEEFLNKADGFKVVGKALNGQEALQLVTENEHVDLLLLDIYMPDFLGTEVMAEIRKINLSIDIIIISAATEKNIIEDAIRFGAFDYIIKPVKMKRFIETLERYKNMRMSLKSEQDIDQHLLDRFFGHSNQGETVQAALTPKGIDPLTLKKIEDIIYKTAEGITAEEMGSLVGASRTTARRYLEYLISEGTLVAELEYGAVGRPERKYFAAKRTDRGTGALS